MRVISLFAVFGLVYYTWSFSMSHIDQLIGCYQRPISFLAVGDFDHTKIMTAAERDRKSVFIVLNKSLNIQEVVPSNIVHLAINSKGVDLNHLRESEHFDVVFVAENFGSFTQSYARQLYNLGEHVFVLLCNGRDNGHLAKAGFEMIETYDNSLLFYACHSINFLRRTQWFEPASDQNCVRRIVSNFFKKTLQKNFGPHPVSSVWLPGINFMTFKALSGKIPSTDQLKGEVDRLFSIPHSDWMPNNIVVQGNNLALIDFEDPYGAVQKTVHTKQMLMLMQEFALDTNPNNVLKNYQDILLYCREQLKKKS